MSAGELLFNEGRLSDALEHQAQLLEKEVQQAPEEHLLNVDVEQWVVALVERWQVDAPELHPDQWSMDVHEADVDVSWDSSRDIRRRPAYVAGHLVVVHIPFTGDAGVFSLQPSTFTYNPPRATIRASEVLQTIEYPSDAPVNVRARTEGLIDDIDRYLIWSRSDIASFNATLEQRARAAIEARRARVLGNYERLAESGIPLRGKPDSRLTYIADEIVRRARASAPFPPRVAADGVRACTRRQCLRTHSRDHPSDGRKHGASPGTYERMGEEDRRQVLLTALNSHYRGKATAEAFNVAGKTDILVRHEERNLFIAECKFWSGRGGFETAIDQLFTYTAWRDTKLALIMFVRERDLTSIIEKARETLGYHPQLVEWRAGASETELRALMSWPGDERRHADLNVFFIHAPK